jgi:uncharacterized membrane protein (UPF0127 family)
VFLAPPTSCCARWWCTESSEGGALNDRRPLRRLPRLLLAAVLIMQVGCGTSSSVVRVEPSGFPTTVVVVRTGGREKRLCMYLADTLELRERGLMDVTSLGKKAGMVFHFAEPTNTRFYMFQTKTALDIAFIDATGKVVSTANMKPCPSTDASACPLTSAAAPYTDAIEVFEKGLKDIGVLPDSIVRVLLEPC